MPAYYSKEMLDYQSTDADAAIKRLAVSLGKLDHANAERVGIPSVLADRIAAWEHQLKTNKE